uniref:Uncharacterized protein n=2 Tax=Ciona intestinalis TaxID=7719 RepID=F6VB18_CIOIN
MVAMQVPDKLSIITYVSQYYNRLHKMKPADDEKPLKRKSTLQSTPEFVKIKRKEPEPVKKVGSTSQPLAINSNFTRPSLPSKP